MKRNKMQLTLLIDDSISQSLLLRILDKCEIGEAIQEGCLFTNKRRAKKIIKDFLSLAFELLKAREINLIRIQEGAVEVYSFDDITKEVSFYEGILWRAWELPLRDLGLKEKEVRYENRV